MGASAAALLGCAEQPDAPRPANIVLVSIDSLRADRLGCYGAERDTSPAIDALARSGARFETTLAPSPWTLASHATLFTGLPVSAHRVDATDKRLDAARQPLAAHLRRLGYRTAAFVSSPFLDRAYGLDSGFDVYQNFQASGEGEFPPNEGSHDRSHRDRSAAEVIDAALDWLEGQEAGGESGWFLFVHLWDVHYDYDPPPPFDTMFDANYTGELDARRLKHNPQIHAGMAARDLEHLRALYDGEIRWVDSQLGRLLDVLEAREEREPILVSVVSDHGEEFFEHGNKAHFKTLFEESLRVPWVLRFRPKIRAGTIVPGVSGLEDVAQTLLGLSGLPLLGEATGRNLESALTSGAEVTRPQLLEFGVQRALRGPSWKITSRGPDSFYYDLDRDPAEQNPQPAEQVAPERLARLKIRRSKAAAIAASWPWQGGARIQLDEAARSRLRELGYVE
jgi:arylsulfatase A-like enzyme